MNQGKFFSTMKNFFKGLVIMMAICFMSACSNASASSIPKQHSTPVDVKKQSETPFITSAPDSDYITIQCAPVTELVVDIPSRNHSPLCPSAAMNYKSRQGTVSPTNPPFRWDERTHCFTLESLGHPVHIKPFARYLPYS